MRRWQSLSKRTRHVSLSLQELLRAVMLNNHSPVLSFFCHQSHGMRFHPQSEVLAFQELTHPLIDLLIVLNAPIEL